jgi:hypothetical protein
LIGHPDQDDAKVLSVRKVDAQVPAGAVWNFPAGVAGRLTTRLQLRPGCKGATLTLTDHFSVVDDSRADEHAAFCLRIDARGRIGPDAALQPGRWHDLTVAWKVGEAEAVVSLDGRRAGSLKALRKTETGINYLRLHSPADRTDEAGFLIASVQAHVTAPGQAPRLTDSAAGSYGLALLLQDGSPGAVIATGKPIPSHSSSHQWRATSILRPEHPHPVAQSDVPAEEYPLDPFAYSGEISVGPRASARENGFWDEPAMGLSKPMTTDQSRSPSPARRTHR